MSKVNGLDNMSATQLHELRGRVDTAIAAAEAAEKKALLDEMHELAAKSGLTIADVLGTKSTSRKTKAKVGKIAVKYRNPADASQTWTGRGRKPLWLVEAVKKGKKLESFLA